MVFQVGIRLGKELRRDVLGAKLTDDHDVSALPPVVQHHLHISPAYSLAFAHRPGFLTGELKRQEVEQVLRTRLLGGNL